jgi:hypothetical protein
LKSTKKPIIRGGTRAEVDTPPPVYFPSPAVNAG